MGTGGARLDSLLIAFTQQHCKNTNYTALSRVHTAAAVSLPASSKCAYPNPDPNIPKFNRLFSGPYQFQNFNRKSTHGVFGLSC